MFRFLFFNFLIFFLGCVYSFAQNCDSPAQRLLNFEYCSQVDSGITPAEQDEQESEIPDASDYIENNSMIAKYKNAYNGALAYKSAMSRISTSLFWALDKDFKNLEELNGKYDAKEIEWLQYSEDWDVLKSSFDEKKRKIDLVKGYAEEYDVSWFFTETTGYNKRLLEKCCLYKESPTWNNELKALELGSLVLPLNNKSSVTTKNDLCRAESYYINFQGYIMPRGNRCNIRWWDYSGGSALLKWRRYAGKADDGRCVEMGDWIAYKNAGGGLYRVNFLFARSMPGIKVFDKDIRKKTRKYAKTITVSGGSGGSVSPSGQTVFNTGDGIDISATPDEGYQIKEWKGTGDSCFQFNADSFNYMDKGTSQFTVHPTRSCGIFVSFERKSYTITYSVETTGNLYRGTIDGKKGTNRKFMMHDYSASFRASPDGGYKIKEWSGDCGTFRKTTNPARFKVRKDCSISVSFEREDNPRYTITTSVIGGNGRITPTETFDSGESVTITASPARGWQIKEPWNNGCNSDSSPATFNATKNCTIRVEFEPEEPVDRYTITTSVIGGNGRITPTETFDSGESVTIIATPAGGWQIKEPWNNGCNSDSSPATFNATKNCTIRVEFEREPVARYTITTSVIGGNGTITPTKTVDSGESVIITAYPDGGWQIKEPWNNGCNSDSSPATFEASKNCFIHVTFEPSDVEPHTITTRVVPILGKLNGGITPTFRVNPGNKAVVTASPDPGYAPTYWGGDCDLSFKSDDYIEDGNVVSFVPKTDCEVTVIFAKTSHTITPSVVGSGGQIRPSDEVTGRYGSSVRFSATPDFNYKIKSWGGDCGVFSGASASFKIVKDCSINVSFCTGTKPCNGGQISCDADCTDPPETNTPTDNTPTDNTPDPDLTPETPTGDGEFTISVSSSSGGYIVGGDRTIRASAGESLEFSADVDSGYGFTSWGISPSDCAGATPDTTYSIMNFAVSKDCSLVANFEWAERDCSGKRFCSEFNIRVGECEDCPTRDEMEYCRCSGDWRKKGECTYRSTCWDNSRACSDDECPAYVRCPVVCGQRGLRSASGNCPSPSSYKTKTCWDGSKVCPSANCPPKISKNCGCGVSVEPTGATPAGRGAWSYDYPACPVRSQKVKCWRDGEMKCPASGGVDPCPPPAKRTCPCSGLEQTEQADGSFSPACNSGENTYNCGEWNPAMEGIYAASSGHCVRCRTKTCWDDNQSGFVLRKITSTAPCHVGPVCWEDGIRKHPDQCPPRIVRCPCEPDKKAYWDSRFDRTVIPTCRHSRKPFACSDGNRYCSREACPVRIFKVCCGVTIYKDELPPGEVWSDQCPPAPVVCPNGGGRACDASECAVQCNPGCTLRRGSCQRRCPDRWLECHEKCPVPPPLVCPYGCGVIDGVCKTVCNGEVVPCGSDCVIPETTDRPDRDPDPRPPTTSIPDEDEPDPCFDGDLSELSQDARDKLAEWNADNPDRAVNVCSKTKEGVDSHDGKGQFSADLEVVGSYERDDAYQMIYDEDGKRRTKNQIIQGILRETIKEKLTSFAINWGIEAVGEVIKAIGAEEIDLPILQILPEDHGIYGRPGKDVVIARSILMRNIKKDIDKKHAELQGKWVDKGTEHGDLYKEYLKQDLSTNQQKANQIRAATFERKETKKDRDNAEEELNMEIDDLLDHLGAATLEDIEYFADKKKTLLGGGDDDRKGYHEQFMDWLAENRTYKVKKDILPIPEIGPGAKRVSNYDDVVIPEFGDGSEFMRRLGDLKLQSDHVFERSDDFAGHLDKFLPASGSLEDLSDEGRAEALEERREKFRKRDDDGNFAGLDMGLIDRTDLVLPSEQRRELAKETVDGYHSLYREARRIKNLYIPDVQVIGSYPDKRKKSVEEVINESYGAKNKDKDKKKDKKK